MEYNIKKSDIYFNINWNIFFIYEFVFFKKKDIYKYRKISYVNIFFYSQYWFLVDLFVFLMFNVFGLFISIMLGESG